MATVELSLSALTAHVRTARLVAVSLGRRAGLGEASLDEVRLAVGEATSRAVGLHAAACPTEPVVVRFSDDEPGVFFVEVVDRVPTDPDPSHDLAFAALAEHGDALDQADLGLLPPAVGLAVIDSLVDDVSVSTAAEGSSVRLSWPVPQPRGGPVSESVPPSA
ncbi:MAG TPA: ATP-binding protein [Candidatus Limnocylindria bacterium]|nr:ATP-binding protein [Candidatus Limnocylindria bacterium]